MTTFNKIVLVHIVLALSMFILLVTTLALVVSGVLPLSIDFWTSLILGLTLVADTIILLAYRKKFQNEIKGDYKKYQQYYITIYYFAIPIECIISFTILFKVLSMIVNQ